GLSPLTGAEEGGSTASGRRTAGAVVRAPVGPHRRHDVARPAGTGSARAGQGARLPSGRSSERPQRLGDEGSAVEAQGTRGLAEQPGPRIRRDPLLEAGPLRTSPL